MTWQIIDAFGHVVCGGFASAAAAWQCAAPARGNRVVPEWKKPIDKWGAL